MLSAGGEEGGSGYVQVTTQASLGYEELSVFFCTKFISQARIYVLKPPSLPLPHTLPLPTGNEEGAPRTLQIHDGEEVLLGV